MRTFSKYLFVLLPLCVSACTSAPIQENPGTPLEKTQWRLARLEGKSVPPSGKSAYLLLEAGRLNGFGGCNRLVGSYKLEGANLEFSAPAGTLMACMDAISQQENAFIQRIPQVKSWAIQGQTLRLGDATDAIILELEAEPPLTPEP
ncbi:MAG: META domain-containing protein [Zoogloeaceae bacterium]|jgi:heat shock protein HslJ|nr:META domain-containing protein [Zoogloeaceae bacterium]